MNFINHLSNGLKPEFFFEKESKSIGKGAFGDILSCSHGPSTYCLKKLSTMQSDKTTKSKIEQEISILAKLQQSPTKPSSIPNFYGYFIEEKNVSIDYFLVFDCYNLTLRKIITDCQKNGRNIEFDVFESFFKQILFGLTFLESKGICHRDLKPTNLMFDKNNKVKIIDFGLSMDLREIRESNDLQKMSNRPYDKEKTKFTLDFEGTQDYMAPEIDEEKYNPEKADVFSFGLIILEMACTKKIKRSESIEISQKIRNEINENIEKLDIIYPLNQLSKYQQIFLNKIKEIAKDCLQIDPNKRPSFIEIFGRTLKNQEKNIYHIKLEEIGMEESQYLFEVLQNKNELLMGELKDKEHCCGLIEAENQQILKTCKKLEAENIKLVKQNKDLKEGNNKEFEDKIRQLDIENEKLKMDLNIKNKLLDEQNLNLIVLKEEKDSLAKMLGGFQEEFILAKSIWQKEKTLLEEDLFKQKNTLNQERMQLSGLINRSKQESSTKDLVITSLMKKVETMDREIDIYRQKSFDEENKKLVAESEKDKFLIQMEKMKSIHEGEKMLSYVTYVLIFFVGILTTKLLFCN